MADPFAMKSHFRSSRPEDAESIAGLMKDVFGMAPDHPGLGMAQMHWKYWNECDQWEGSRGFLIERKGEVVAHGAVVPLDCIFEGRRMRVVHLIDWAARRDSTGAGISLMKRVGELVDGVFAAGGSKDTQAILPVLGFRVIGRATRFVFPIHFRLDEIRFLRSWRSPARLARNLAFRAMRGAAATPPKGWRSRRLAPSDLATHRLPVKESDDHVAFFTRTPSAIARSLQCPVAPGECFLVEHEGESCGYFVLSFAGTECRIAEAWMESGLSSEWQALFALAVDRAREHPQVIDLAAVANTEVEIQALRRTGFAPWRLVNLRFWTRKGTPPADIRYQMVDGDAAYLHDSL
jgi:hypothetical protein